MSQRLVACLLFGILFGCGGADHETADTSSTANYDELVGFIDLFWDDAGGQLFIRIEHLDTPFIYQSSLPRGIGSNDIGVDRGQLGATRVVRFVRSGPKVLMVEDNLAYRANSDNADERRAVDESFARSVVWGFEITSENDDGVLVDGTAFFLRDAHGITPWLAAREEGDYRPDASRSAIYLPRTKAFPDNTEVEAIVSYTGNPTGAYLPTVAPDATTITVHSHHSFIRLPDDNYEPLPYDPRAGVIGFGFGSPGFIDYATPIGDELFVNYGRRHRLKKVNPEAEVSEAVEPIIYYVDRGAPEPVRSALIEGASWWNQAYEAAGYRDAFQVKLLPEDADPMDVRYNVIQWVHRSTRGWSYGSSVLDPRTGEILKGHVSLGSLRVRQDYLIAEGLLAPYADESVPDAMLDMSLARIRQLSAHEVGHTIGFEHNFAASTQDRASVMDYPVPLIRFADTGELDLSDAYAVGIGSWDERTVLYAYQDFVAGVDTAAARTDILRQTIADGYRFVGDGDSRSVGSAHPDGNLWDNGADAIEELEHLMAVREFALGRFADTNIRIGRADATLEEVLVPIYLLHRFQLHAVGKLVGGMDYAYSMRGDGQEAQRPVSAERQRQAIAALLATLTADELRLPAGLAQRIPPRPPGHPKSRETFNGRTGPVFDPLAPAASATALALEVLLHPQRAARMNRNGAPDFGELVDKILAATWRTTAPQPDAALQRQTNMLALDAFLRLAVDDTADGQVRGAALLALERIDEIAGITVRADTATLRHFRLARYKIDRGLADPASIESLPEVTVPPGSPIGAMTERDY